MEDEKITEIEAKYYKDDLTGWKHPTGFYYDEELHNPLTRVTLHANKKYNNDKVLVKEKDKPDKTVERKFTLDGPWVPVGDKDDDGYSLTPIATSIFSEDFSFDIANNFSEFGDDPIGSLWNSQAATAPYSKLISEAFQSMSAKSIDWSEEKGGVGWADAFAKFGGFMSSALGKDSRLRSRALRVNGTQFSYYSGTNINFNNMSMKFTLLSDWEGDSFKSVIEKLNGGEWPLLAYVIGDYIPVTEVGDGAIGTFISSWASWQLPPGGFRANLKNVDTINEGTLKLKFGPYFSINNLIISGCSISMSKNMIRNPKGNGTSENPYIVPMSCDVTLQFKPAANFSKVTLTKILTGETKYLNQVTTKLFKNV